MLCCFETYHARFTVRTLVWAELFFSVIMGLRLYSQWFAAQLWPCSRGSSRARLLVFSDRKLESVRRNLTKKFGPLKGRVKVRGASQSGVEYSLLTPPPRDTFGRQKAASGISTDDESPATTPGEESQTARSCRGKVFGARRKMVRI